MYVHFLLHFSCICTRGLVHSAMKYKNNFNNIGLRMLNQLPQYIKEIPVLNKFKKTLKTFLLDHCFYSISINLFAFTDLSLVHNHKI
jgi:hypothetical protein